MSSWNTKLSIQSLQNQINKITESGPIQNPLTADINANNKNINAVAGIQANTLTANLINCSQFNPPISSEAGPPGPEGPPGPAGTSSFKTTLYGGATYINDSYSDIQFIASNASYASTIQAFPNGCYISCQADNSKVSYMGLSLTSEAQTPLLPFKSFKFGLYLDGDNHALYTIIDGIINDNVMVPSIGSSTLSILYYDTTIQVYINNNIVSAFTNTTTANTIFYGIWSGYNNSSLLNIVWSPIVQGPQGATGGPGPTGATGPAGPAGSVETPVNNLVTFNQGVTLNNSYLTMKNTATNGLAQIHFDSSIGSSYQLLETYNSLLLQYYPPSPNQSKYENFIDIDGSNSTLTLGFGDRSAPAHSNNNALVIGPDSNGSVGQCTLNVPLLMGDSLSGSRFIAWGDASGIGDNSSIDSSGGLALNNKTGVNQGNLRIYGSLLTYVTNTNGVLETVLTANNSGLDVTGAITVNGEPIKSEPFVPFKSLIGFNNIIKNVPVSTATSLMSWNLSGSPTYVSMNLTNISLTYNFPNANLATNCIITFFIDSSPTNSYSSINQQVYSITIPTPKAQGQNYTFTNFNNTISLSATAQTQSENYNTLYLKCLVTQPGAQTTPIRFTNMNGSATINAYKVNVPITVSPSL